MRIRTIKPEFYRSDDIAALSREHRLLFIGLWSYVDDNGVGIDDYRHIAADLFALEPDPDEARAFVREGLATLSRALQHDPLILRYEVDGRRYLKITKWDRHQKIDRPGRARFPQPPPDFRPLTSDDDDPERPEDDVVATDSRECRDGLDAGTGEQGNRGTEENTYVRPPDERTGADEHDPASIAADATITRATKIASDVDAEFETWWAQWPRKIAKKKALSAYRAARKAKIPAELLLSTAADQLAAWRAADRPVDKIPHPTTWLNQERWNDEIERPRFTVITNPDSPWQGYRVDTGSSPWAADMSWTS